MVTFVSLESNPTCICIEYFKIKSNWFYLEFNGDVLVSLFSQQLFEQFYFSTKWLFSAWPPRASVFSKQ